MGKQKAGDLFLASAVHVNRGSKEKPEIAVVPGNRFVSETDLSAKEIESIKPFGILRVATMEEMSSAENREANQSEAEAVQAAEAERVRIQQEQKLERDGLEAEQKAEAEKARQKLEEQQAKERDDAAKKSAGSGGKKK